MVSFAPVTVTVCVALQFAAVNLRLDTLTVPSVVSLLTTGTITLSLGDGCVRSATVKVMLVPDSLVTMSLGVEITKLAGLLSVLVRLMVFRPTPLYTAEVLFVGPTCTL